MLGFYPSIALNILLLKHRYKWKTPPKGSKALYEFAGKYDYVEDAENPGFVKIIDGWEARNIIDVALPLYHPATGIQWRIKCHRKIVTNVKELFGEYASKGFHGDYPIRQLGCFVPRHKMSDPNRSLSIHAYGLAIDINWLVNKVGFRGDMPANVVTLFKQYGWLWGGWWTRPLDPMHFQFYSRR